MGRDKKVEDPESNGTNAVVENDKAIKDWNFRFDYTVQCFDLTKDGSWQALEIPEPCYNLDEIIEGSPSGHLRLILTKTWSSMRSHKPITQFFSLSPRSSLVWTELRDERGFWEPQDPEAWREFLQTSKTFGQADKAYLLLDAAESSFDSIVRIKQSSDRMCVIVLFPSSTSLILSAGEQWRLLGRWLRDEGELAIQSKAGNLEMLFRLFLLDLIIFESSEWKRCFQKLKRDTEANTDPPDYITTCAIVEHVDTFAEKADALLHSLRSSSELGSDRDSANRLDTAIRKLTLRVSAIKRLATQFQNFQKARREDYIQKRNETESQAVKRLTILAAIFLPLSLTTGVLSMQSRLRDIHLILWDFVCICLDLGIIVFASFWISKPSRLPAALKEIKWWYSIILVWVARDSRDDDHENKKWDTVWLVLSLPVLIVIAVALNFGMFGQVRIAWKILGYGVAASVGALITLGPLYAILNALLSNPWKRKRSNFPN